jgi:hypothetical protein
MLSREALEQRILPCIKVLSGLVSSNGSRSGIQNPKPPKVLKTHVMAMSTVNYGNLPNYDSNENASMSINGIFT